MMKAKSLFIVMSEERQNASAWEKTSRSNMPLENLGSITSLEGYIVRKGDNGVAVRFV